MIKLQIWRLKKSQQSKRWWCQPSFIGSSALAVIIGAAGVWVSLHGPNPITGKTVWDPTATNDQVDRVNEKVVTANKGINDIKQGLDGTTKNTKAIKQSMSVVADDVETANKGINDIKQNIGDVAKTLVAANRNINQVDTKIDSFAARTDQNLELVAEDVATTNLGINQMSTEVTAMRAQLALLLGSDRPLVALTSEQIGQLRNLDQPMLNLFYYDQTNSPRAFDGTAPEFHSGQFLNLKTRRFVKQENQTPTEDHRYLLAINSNADVDLYLEKDVAASGGDWQIDDRTNFETLLVLTADHELSESEKEQLKNRLQQMPTDGKLAIRPNQYYEWLSGEIIQRPRLAGTRDLKRNPDAPVDWVQHVNNVLFEEGLAYHGYTYPVATDDDL